MENDNAYKAIFDILPYGIFYFDKNGIIIDCNQIFLDSINSTKELMIGFDAVNQLKNKDVIQAIKDCIKTGSGYYEGPYISVTGDKNIQAKGVFKSIYKDNGDFRCGVCTLDDITTQHEQKQKLIELNNEINTKNEFLEKEKIKNLELIKNISLTEKNYRTIFYNSPIPMIVHSKGLIILINNAAMKFADIKKTEDIIGLPVLQFVHESSRETAMNNIAKVMKGESTEMQEEKFMTINGKIKEVVVNSGQFVYNGELTLLVAFADISEITESKIKLERLNLKLTEQNNKLINETKKNKEILLKLANAEKNYRTIVENSPIPILVHLDGKFVYVNDEAVKFIKLKNKEEIIGKSIINFIHPDSQKFAQENIRKVLEGQKPKLVEEKFLTIKGETRNVLLNTGQFIYDNKTAIVAAFVDITEIKESEEQIKIISKGIDTSPASIVITDVSGDIQFVNPKFVEVTGYTAEEALGENPRILKSGYHNAKFYNEMWIAISNGDSWRGEIQNKRKNGEIYWEYAIISPILNDDGKITHYIAIKEDVTKRKDIERKLLKNQKHFRTLYDTAPDGIFELDEEGVITNCNVEFANSVKLKKSQLIGRKAANFIKNKELFKRLFDQLIKRGFVESEIIQENGDKTTTVVWRKVTAIYDKDDNFTGAIAYNREITDIKEVENQLIEAKEKAEEADNLKTAFLSNMSHEIRTPLNAIVGFTELLSKKEINNTDKEKYSNYIKHNSTLLLNLINDIVDVSKIEANQIKISKEPVEIESIFIELHQMFLEENTISSDVDFNLKISNENIVLNTDEFRLRQIISNLISNAIKFTDSGEISFGYYVEKDKLIIFVKDTGEGINNEFVSKIFKRFFKLGTLTNNKGGTGLGLSIVKSLTELLDGEAEVESEKYVGTEFRIIFPYDENLSASIEEKNDDDYNISSFDWGNKTVLIAEDDEFNFIVLEEYLKASNINIIHAKDGIEAIELFKDNKDKIDLILMDVQMPRLDGYSSSKEILKIDKDAKIISQTAFAMSNERNKSLEVGCIDYITKPIDIKVLTLLFANYLR